MNNDNTEVLENYPQDGLQSNSHIIWKGIQSRLHKFYGNAIYDSWLSVLLYVSTESGKVLLSAPTRFIKEWILVHYLDQILKYWQDEDQSICSVDICVVSNQDPNLLVDIKDRVDRGIKGNCDNVSSPLDPRFTFDNFVVGKPNELAFAAARRVAESNSPISGSNPLFLYGGVGLGKTHLMHAIAWYIIKSCSKRKIAYLSAEKFMYQYVTALRSKDIMLFKEQFRSVDILMVDDVQFISGKDSTQEEFFHTFNALIDQNKQLVISADRSPSDLDGVEERIKSRLGWGLVADINETTFELRLGILQLKVEKMGINIPNKVLEFLAKNIKSNIRELEGALNKVVAHSSLVGCSITLDTASDILSDLLRANHKSVTLECIQKKVAEFFNIKVSDMYSTRRLRTLARPRQIAMYLSKKLTQKSLPEIGKSFGGRDHATVIHAVKQIEKLMDTDSKLRDDINLLNRMLR
ncbi:chromosomal replication initiation protein [Ehrlichia ruminantium]|uniref:Chromosomal replication initiator protein DnaA n=2 Tax=Ehrlichia ruminantium TaxID=779 RepID=DNAA_EHRRG|nr:chromosomal replication initiator protein DnaA [Ehrlichia ruminantium]Q5FHH8.1 RecName: Full=Chromosomal replication initiator protein DnaA [Ehrlichia ruminantium str. Gardel]Q5HBP0.1 RecName: Full=Chromosomal replication initiator protein DnaA [Ehrlichia ruminantium str. Welgevonden]KYW97948.1 chromosomal replication initiation protein DnaA [Ehrlichia ruminantium]QLK50364.1 chromosomal replication initiator protein DnaA [Ehrlichia ruminantium]QLK51288.1 chromosomal replication initiator pr